MRNSGLVFQVSDRDSFLTVLCSATKRQLHVSYFINHLATQQVNVLANKVCRHTHYGYETDRQTCINAFLFRSRACMESHHFLSLITTFPNDEDI